MFETKYHFLPVILAILLPVTMVITYSIAVANDHVEPGFPYISDTGTYPPESCVFGQLLNFAALIGGLIVYVRYKHLVELYGDVPRFSRLMTANKVAFVFGLIANLGMSIVGNFQETSVGLVHLFGAFLAFFIGFVYAAIQTVMSWKMPDLPGNSRSICIFRSVICAADFVMQIILGAAAVLSRGLGPGPNVSKLKWTSADPGYAEHLTATIAEWFVALLTVAFFGTFYNEFKHFRVISPQIKYNDDVKEENHRVATISQSTADQS